MDWNHMPAFIYGHWLAAVLLWAVLVLYPFGRILTRMGLSPFLSLLALIPVVNLITLWVVAFIDWPRKSD